jgi:CheY-like chemotaxis protein
MPPYHAPHGGAAHAWKTLMSRHPLADSPARMVVHWIGVVFGSLTGGLLAQTTQQTPDVVVRTGYILGFSSLIAAISPVLLQVIKTWSENKAADRALKQRMWEEEREERRANMQMQLDQQKAEMARQKADADRQMAEAKGKADAAEAKAHDATAEAEVTKRRLEDLEAATSHVADQVAATKAVAAGNQGDLAGFKERLRASGVDPTAGLLQGQVLPAPTVLVVEDNEQAMELICREFSAAGFSVTKAPDLNQAFYRLRDSPHWVVTDVKLLGGQDGLDLVRLIRNDHLPINVVVCSGWVDDPEVRAKLDGLNPEVVMSKPVDFKILLAHMKAVPRAAGRPDAAGGSKGSGSDGPRPA